MSRVPEWVPVPVTYHAVLEEVAIEQAAGESLYPAHGLRLETQSLSFVSLPCMKSRSVYDGLQTVCVSRSLCTKISALLAVHVSSSGGSVEDSIALGEDL